MWHTKAIFVIFSDTDNCSPNPCQNGGVCTDLVDDYVCKCQDRFVGKDCETSKQLIHYVCKYMQKTIGSFPGIFVPFLENGIKKQSLLLTVLMMVNILSFVAHHKIWGPELFLLFCLLLFFS